MARLKEVRTYLGKSQPGMDDLLGIGKKSWQRYESGGQVPGGKVLRALTRQGINVSWVLEGGFGGPMLLDEGGKDKKTAFNSPPNVVSENFEGKEFEASLARSREAAARHRQLVGLVKEEALRFGYEMPDDAANDLANVMFTGDCTADGLVRFIVLLKKLGGAGL